MKTDIKIGIALGIIVVVAALIWIMDHTDKSDQQPPITPPPVKLPAEAAQSIKPQPSPVEKGEPAGAVPSQSESDVVVTPPPASIESPVKQPEPIIETAVPAAPIPQEPPRPEKRYHIVQRGETLSGISEQYYGHGRFWKVIYDANKSVIKNADKVPVGLKLRIPYPEEIADINP